MTNITGMRDEWEGGGRSEEIEISVDAPTPVTCAARVGTVQIRQRKRKYMVPEQGDHQCTLCKTRGTRPRSKKDKEMKIPTLGSRREQRGTKIRMHEDCESCNRRTKDERKHDTTIVVAKKKRT